MKTFAFFVGIWAVTALWAGSTLRMTEHEMIRKADIIAAIEIQKASATGATARVMKTLKGDHLKTVQLSIPLTGTAPRIPGVKKISKRQKILGFLIWNEAQKTYEFLPGIGALWLLHWDPRLNDYRLSHRMDPKKRSLSDWKKEVDSVLSENH